MKNYLFITIDTEEDNWGSYKTTQPSLENIKNIPKLQAIFEKYSAIPTYMINYPVATDKYSIEMLGELSAQKKCEIGTHCHPWNTPPHVIKEHNEWNSYMCNLSEELILEKMVQLHNTIIKNFNSSPIAFRAGRWGVGDNVIKVIKQLKYKIDTSITPFKDWSEYSGPIFDLQTNSTYGLRGMDQLCLRATNCLDCEKSKNCIIEIPPTIGFLQKNYKLCHKVRKILSNSPYPKFKILGILSRLKILNYVALSPEIATCADMIKLSDVIINKRHRFLNMFFHSTSLLPGASPFVKDDEDLEGFLNKIDNYLAHMTKNGTSCVGLSQALKVLQ